MRTSLNIPQEVLESFDTTWQEEGLESCSRAVREAIHEYIERYTELEGSEGPAVAVLAFDYEHTLVIGQLHTVQHEFEDIISTTQHMHQEEWCLENHRGKEDEVLARNPSTPLLEEQWLEW